MSGDSTCVAAGRWQAEKGQNEGSDNPKLCTKQTQIRSNISSKRWRETFKCHAIWQFDAAPAPLLCLISDTVFDSFLILRVPDLAPK